MESEAREILEDAGWFDGRRIDTTDIVACLVNYGYPVFSKQIEFFAEFGGLKFVAANDNDRIILDIVDLSRKWLYPFEHGNYDEGSMFPGERVSILGRFINTPFVGDEDYNTITIMIAESGGVYLTEDTWGNIVGLTPLEAIENLAMGRCPYPVDYSRR